MKNRRNGYIHKTVKTIYVAIPLDVPRNRDAPLEPQAIPKHIRDVREIEDKGLSMYERDIAETIEDFYGFGISHEIISKFKNVKTKYYDYKTSIFFVSPLNTYMLVPSASHIAESTFCFIMLHCSLFISYISPFSDFA